MGKRSDFQRKANDYYRTFDPRAVKALLPHLKPRTYFVEPCAGDGILIDQLLAHGHKCVSASDIEPQRDGILEIDALELSGVSSGTKIITNPPWLRPILHAMIEHFSTLAETWLLFDADWMQTKQSAEYMKKCKMVVAIGRLKWIPDTKMDGKDNCAWYCFGNEPCSTIFVGR